MNQIFYIYKDPLSKTFKFWCYQINKLIGKYTLVEGKKKSNFSRISTLLDSDFLRDRRILLPLHLLDPYCELIPMYSSDLCSAPSMYRRYHLLVVDASAFVDELIRLRLLSSTHVHKLV